MGADVGDARDVHPLAVVQAVGRGLGWPALELARPDLQLRRRVLTLATGLAAAVPVIVAALFV